jgi:diaminopimelate decarboxylase
LPEKIVYDSPAKTVEEIRTVLERGIHLNADSLQELERIDRTLDGRAPKGPIGIRINPQIGLGDIPSTSVSGSYSKFGVPLQESRREILEAFGRYHWLSGVHVHIGSQGYPVERLAAGVASVVALALEADPPIRFVDIGGGLPVAYRPGERIVSAREYRTLLIAASPALNNPPFRMLTEFGRYVQAAAGWAVTRIEYVRHGASGNTVVTHLGADMFLRACYDPGHWHHEITLTDSAGIPKEGPALPYNVAGPLCFGGDIIRRNCPLPGPEPGDLLVIHDAGAYTLGMWSRYNSRPIPRVIGIEKDGLTLGILKEREEPEDLWDFWS